MFKKYLWSSLFCKQGKCSLQDVFFQINFVVSVILDLQIFPFPWSIPQMRRKPDRARTVRENEGELGDKRESQGMSGSLVIK